jgi:hypothetical protein
MLGLISCLALLLPAATARAAISLTGTAVVNATNSAGTLNVANGSLGLLIVDVAGNGFLGINNSGSPFLPPSDDPRIPSAAASLRVGGLFGGDVVLARMSAAPGGTFSVSLPSISILPYVGKSFAIVWFDQIQNTTAPTVAPTGTTYGIAHGSDWILPAANSGSYIFSPTDSNGAFSYYQVDLGLGPISPDNFRTINSFGAPAASFTVVPEPGFPLLASAASLLFFRRRRNRESPSSPPLRAPLATFASWRFHPSSLSTSSRLFTTAKPKATTESTAKTELIPAIHPGKAKGGDGKRSGDGTRPGKAQRRRTAVPDLSSAVPMFSSAHPATLSGIRKTSSAVPIFSSAARKTHAAMPISPAVGTKSLAALRIFLAAHPDFPSAVRIFPSAASLFSASI